MQIYCTALQEIPIGIGHIDLFPWFSVCQEESGLILGVIVNPSSKIVSIGVPLLFGQSVDGVLLVGCAA